MRLALAATAASSILVVRSHASITSHCCDVGSQVNFAHAVQRPQRLGPTPNHLQVLLHPVAAISMSGAMSGARPASGRHPKVHPKAEPTVIASPPISNSFFTRPNS
jgi:hypothetical protein